MCQTRSFWNGAMGSCGQLESCLQPCRDWNSSKMNLHNTALYTVALKIRFCLYPLLSVLLFSRPASICSLRALSRSSFSMATLRNCWKLSLDDLIGQGVWVAIFPKLVQESACFSTISLNKREQVQVIGETPKSAFFICYPFKALVPF